MLSTIKRFFKRPLKDLADFQGAQEDLRVYVHIHDKGSFPRHGYIIKYLHLAKLACVFAKKKIKKKKKKKKKKKSVLFISHAVIKSRQSDRKIYNIFCYSQYHSNDA